MRGVNKSSWSVRMQNRPKDVIWTEPYTEFLGWPNDGYAPDGDIAKHYRALNAYRGQYMGFVCPYCKTIFPPHLHGMPEGFRAHIRDGEELGCAGAPKTKTNGKKGSLKAAGDF